MIWEKLTAGAEKFRASAKESFFVQTFVGEPPPVGEIGKRRIAFQRTVLKQTEKAVIAGWHSGFRDRLFSVPLHCYGVFFLLFGAVSLILPLLAGNPVSFDLLSLGLLISGLPLCFSGQTLAEGLESAGLARLFLFDYCGFSAFSGFGQTAKNPIWQFFFAGVVAGALGSLIGVGRILLFLLLAVLLPVVFAIPEAILPPILLLFPFLGWTGHSSLFLGVLAGLSLLFRLPKLFSGHRQDAFGKIDLLVLLFGFLLVFDGIVSAAGIEGGGLLSCVYLFSAWFALRPALLNPKWRTRVFFCFLLSGAVCSGIGILQYFSGNASKNWLEIGRFDLLGGRVSSTFSNPNFLAVYLLAVFGVSLGWVFKKGKSRFFGWLPLLLSAGCLIVTWTRGAWLGALAAGCFFLLVCSSSTFAVLSILPLSLPGILPLLPEGIRTRFGSIGNLAETSIRYRIETWKGVLRLIADHPFGIGSGEDTFHRVYPLYAVSGTESVMHAHNVYLQIAVEHGLVGFFLFLFLLFLLFRAFFACRIKSEKSNDKPLFLGIAAGLVGLLTMGFFDHLWYQPSLFYLFAMLAAGLSAFALSAGEGIYET